MILLEKAIQALADNQVEFVIVGGVAITVHSTGYVTRDFDFCYSRSKDNLTRIVSALGQFEPRPRDFPRDLPYFFDERSLRIATNFTFETSIGEIDLLGEVAGIGDFAEVKTNSQIFTLFDRRVAVLTIDALIKAKRAAGRTKDLLVLPELEALREALSDED